MLNGKKHKNNSSTERIDAYPIGINTNQVNDLVKNIHAAGYSDGKSKIDIASDDVGIREAVRVYCQNLRIRILSLYEDWRAKKERSEKKLNDLRENIKLTERVILSLDHVRIFRGLIYVTAGFLFFLGEVDFSRDTIIEGFGKKYDKWLQWALILGLASVPILLKVSYERFIEPFYNARDPEAHRSSIRRFHFGVGAFVIASFTVLAVLRSVYAKYQKITVTENIYDVIENTYPYLTSMAMVAIALLFLIGSAILLTVGLKELSQWYKLMKTKRTMKKMLKKKKILEHELDNCRKHFNRYMNSMQFMNNQELFEQYIEDEIKFAVSQYQRGKLEGIAESKANAEIGDTNGADSNHSEVSKQKTDAAVDDDLIGHIDKYIDPMKEYHLLVRKKLDNIAALQ